MITTKKVTISFVLACALLTTASMVQTIQAPVVMAESLSSQKINPDHGAIPVNPNATPEAKAVLRYLNALSSDALPGVISGQIAGTVDSIQEEFQTSIVKLHDDTGKWVGGITLEYEFSERATPKDLSAANKVVIQYWKAGGLISVSWAPINPWNDKGNWPFDYDFNASVDMEDLITPGSPVYEKWQANLARIADALTELKKAGVVVLWRPFYEMNGFWYWWGTLSHPKKPQVFVRVYRHMFDYFVKKRGLNNLLWVYSPNHYASCGDSRCKPVDWAYPGDDVIDLIGGTSYGHKLEIADYDTYTKFRKPLLMAEYSPENEENFDNRLYLKRLLEEYPRIAAWTSWSEKWSMNAHPGAKELLNHRDIINRDDINWKQFLEKHR